VSWERTLSGGQAPVYLLHGDERFNTREAIAWLRTTVLAGGIEDFNLDRFDAKEGFDVDRITHAARTLPMMCPKRLVWVRNAEAAFGRSKDYLGPLLAYLEAPDPMACLVFEATCKVKKSTTLYKRIAKVGCIYEAITPRERELPGWVSARVRHTGRQISGSAADALVDAIGGDLAALQTAIERLSLYVSEPDRIEEAHVRETISHTRTHSVWELVDAVANRHVSKALSRAHQLLGQGQAPLQLLALIIRQFRQLLIGCDVRRRGGSVSEAAAEAGVPRFRERQFGTQLNQYGFDELLVALERLERADASLKSSKLADELIFESTLLDLCAPKS
jgi:DNA polymerase III subunit delta